MSRLTRSRSVAVDPLPEPDLVAARRRVVELMGIPGTSGDEMRVRDYIVSALRAAGAPAKAVRSDEVFRKSPLGGHCGNLALVLPGTMKGPRRLLMAHMDTVPLCLGSQPIVRGRLVRSANKQSGLGADDRGGCAVVLTAALEILRQRLPHPPVTFFWPVQEEVGLHGVHYGDLKLLDKPKLAFNWDGGSFEKLAVGATGAYRIEIDIQGLASHAGAAPERGVSAITIAGIALAQLHRDGWLGKVRQRQGEGTANVGVIEAGQATNVITERARVRAECRSHSPEFRQRMLKTIVKAFEEAARQVTNCDGTSGSVQVSTRLDYESFRLDEQEPCVVAAEGAIRAAGGTPARAISNGGLDANWLTARGIPTVTLGCGQQNVHTVAETLNLDDFEAACRIGLWLATAREPLGTPS